jgi:hypothetical protein
MNVIKVQLLLRPEWRNPAGSNQAAAAATALGMKITGTGAATLSAELSAERFAELFGAAPTPAPAKGRGTADFGSPAGYAPDDESEKTVPAELERFVSNVDVAAPYIRMR